jgi:hypothetical protein
MFPASVRVDPCGEVFSSRDGELFPGGELPIAIPTCHRNGTSPANVSQVRRGMRKATARAERRNKSELVPFPRELGSRNLPLPTSGT